MTRGQLHYIGDDIGGNLGLAWTVAARDWPLLARWLNVWARPTGDEAV